MTVTALLCDLDGVVYRGAEPCPGAVEGLTAARDAGLRVLFMTNNASRPPDEVARHLSDLGLPTAAEDVLGASQVAATVLAHQRPDLVVDAGAASPGPVVLAVGGPGVALALEAVGLRAVLPAQTRAAAEAEEPLPVQAVVQGYGGEVSALDLAEAAYAIAAGATWIATNDDATLPTQRGLAPGNGALVAALSHATGAGPQVVGKPHEVAYEVALARLGVPAQQCLMIGDRLETDIGGARAAGLRTALVLTGVASRSDAESAPEALRPDHVAETIPQLARLWGSS